MKRPLSVYAAFSLLLLLSCLSLRAQVIKLNSYATAKPTIFLDFDGHHVSGTSWNWSGPFTAAPSGFSNAAIEEIFNRVAEDFRPFNINITTDSTVYFKAPLKQRTRVIVTPTSSWYGNAGGAAWVGSFSWGDETPCFVFCNKLSYSKKNTAEACSHEAGHTLGLQHQSKYDGNCNLQEEYHSGKGSGEISWAPIMGNSYSRNLTTWTKGSSVYGCNYIQDDIKTITSTTNKINFRADDCGDDIATASAIPMGPNLFATSGILTRMDDRDVFSLSLFSPSHVQINAAPYNVDLNNSGANLDIRMSMLNEAGDTISTYNPADKLSAAADTFLNAGTYYFAIEGVGNSYLSDTSSIGFYSIEGNYVPTGILPSAPTPLTGIWKNGKHLLQWKAEQTAPGQETELQVSINGSSFETIYREGNQPYFYHTPETNGSYSYRLKTRFQNGQTVFSNTVALEGTSEWATIAGQTESGKYRIHTASETHFQLMDVTGRMVEKGKKPKGNWEINLPATGIFLLHLSDGLNNETLKLIKR